MPKYKVDIVEKTLHQIEVVAANEHTAKQLAMKRHLNKESTFITVEERFLHPKIQKEEV